MTSANQRHACEFQLIRYIPDPIRNEFVHVGVLLREQRAETGEPATELRFHALAIHLSHVAATGKQMRRWHLFVRGNKAEERDRLHRLTSTASRTPSPTRLQLLFRQ